MTLADVYDDYRSDRAFDHLRSDVIVLVPGEGSSRPKVMIVGEAPGATENTARRPFIGASGQVLRSLITDVAGLRPEQYFITNTIKYRPPGNRKPTGEEVRASLPYLRREYAALGRPPVLVAVGGTAYSALKPEGLKAGILASAGQRIRLSSTATLVVMAHPAYALRNDSYRPEMERHWDEFGRWFEAQQG